MTDEENSGLPEGRLPLANDPPCTKTQNACSSSPDTQKRSLILRGKSPLRDQLILENTAFVRKVAKEYKNRGLPDEDLINEGMVGLIEAAERFDESRGIKFISFAVWWIRRTILRALARQAPMVRVPVNLYRNLKREFEEGVVKQDALPHLHGPAISLESTTTGGEDGLRLSDRLVDTTVPAADETLITKQGLEAILLKLQGLPPKEQKVLRLRFGLEDGTSHSLSDIGEMMGGLSRERVRQIEHKGLRRLRRLIEEDAGLTGELKEFTAEINPKGSFPDGRD